MSTLLPIIDTGPTAHGWHKSETILVCPQKWAWTYLPRANGATPQLIGLDGETSPDAAPVPVEADVQPAEPLIRGTLIHVALAHWYELIRRGAFTRLPGGPLPQSSAIVPFRRLRVATEGGSYDNPVARMPVIVPVRDALEESIGRYEDNWPGCTDAFRSNVRQAITSYIGFNEADPERYEVLGAEVVFSETISFTDRTGRVFTAPFTQRVDLVIRSRANGLVYYFDHKSTTNVSDKRVPKRYVLSGQFLAMQYLGRLRHGDLFGGVFPNLVGLKPIDFARPPLEPAPFRLMRWPRDYVHAKRTKDVFTAAYGTDPRDWPGVDSELACVTAYGPCPFWERCRWGNDSASVGAAP